MVPLKWLILSLTCYQAVYSFNELENEGNIQNDQHFEIDEFKDYIMKRGKRKNKKKNKNKKNKNTAATIDYLPFKDSKMTPAMYFKETKNSTECPNRMKRLNLDFFAKEEYSVVVKPSSAITYGKAELALDKATDKKLEGILLSMNETGVKMEIKPVGRSFVSIRRLCTWNFMVDKVDYTFLYKGKTVYNGNWIPMKNTNWFRFGCSDNAWLKIDTIVLKFEHHPRVDYSMKDLFAEICILKK